MDTADAVVKHYKATSTDTFVYLYVRDSDLNTTHTGESTWISTYEGSIKILGAISTGADDNDRSAATYDNVATTSSGSGTGATLSNIIITGGLAVVTDIEVTTRGKGYAAADTLTVDGALIGGSATDDDLVIVITSVMDLTTAVDVASTWTLDGNAAIGGVANNLSCDGAFATFGNITAGGTDVLRNNNNAGTLGTASVPIPVTSAAGTGMTVTVTVDADGVVATNGSTITVIDKGCGYGATEALIIDTAYLGGGTTDIAIPLASVAANQPLPAAVFTKAEDSDGGVTGPNLYLGDDTPITELEVKQGGSSLIFDARNNTNGTFSLTTAPAVGGAIATDGIKATYSYTAQDRYTGGSTGSKRVHVTSSSDATGEWLLIKEVSDEGVTNNEYTGGVRAGISGVASADVAFDVTGGETNSTRTAGTYVFHDGDYTYGNDAGDPGKGLSIQVVVDSAGKAVATVWDGRGGVDYADGDDIDLALKDLGASETGAKLELEVSDEVQTSGEAAVNTGIFMGRLAINTDASAGAANNGAVWVQDGDTLTASFYAAKASDGTTGALTKTTTATIDATAPTISNVSPADGTLSNDTTPSLTFTIEDGGSGFDASVSNFGDHVDVTVNGCEIPDSALGVTNHSSGSITVQYNAAVAWTGIATGSGGNDITCAAARTGGGFNVGGTTGPTALTSSTVHGTMFSWYIKATDEAGNTKAIGVDEDDAHVDVTIESELDMRIDITAPAATAVNGAKAWSTSTKKDVDDNSSVKITFNESLDADTVSAADFTVSGVGVISSTIETVTMGGTAGTTDSLVYLDLAADLGPNAKPKVKLVGEVKDRAGNKLKPSSTETTGKTLGTATDSVKPTLSDGAVSAALIVKKGKSDITFASNENLTKTGVGYGTDRGTYAVVSGGGKESGTLGVVTLDGTGDAGNVKVSLSNPKSAKGTLKHDTAEDGVPMTKTGIYGLAAVGRDAADNVGVGGITKVIEDVSASFAENLTDTGDDDLITKDTASADTIKIKLKKWPIADHDGDGSLMDSITNITVGGSAVPDLIYVDADAASTVSAGGNFRYDSTVADHADTTFTITTGAALTSGTIGGPYTSAAATGSGGCDAVTFSFSVTATNQTMTPADFTVVTGDTDCIMDETLTIAAHGASHGDAALIFTLTGVGNGVVDATDNIGGYISKIDWSETEQVHFTAVGGSEVNIADDSTVKVTYYHVNASQVVELDLDAPTVVIVPSNLASTIDKTPSLSFTWDDDEYAGDNYTTVVMTKVELKDPDGATTDILADVTTTDNKTFYYVPIADLANGEYTVTVSAKDVAGNEKKDQTSKFTVKDRSKTTIAMVPGWNLISLPGTPADGAINNVISNTQVEQVLTYDPSTPGGWLTAIRDGDALVGTLNTIDAEHAYWIFQKNGDDIKVDLPGYKGGASAAPPAIRIVEGWNLIPTVTLTVGQSTVATSVDADAYMMGIDWVKAKGWNAGTEVWEDKSPTLDLTATNRLTSGDAFTVGNGYWLYSNEAGVIVP
jgi:hypothetical protein